MIHLRDPDDDTISGVVTMILEGVRNRASLARELGVNRAMIYNWLKGRHPSIPELSKIAYATNTSLRIDLGPEAKEPPSRNDRLEVLEGQMSVLLQSAVANQEAILELLRRFPPSPV